MEKTDKRYQAYIDILREELIPAMGCTEPIAVAYAAAAARNTLGELPDKVLVEASGSMIKNVKSVIVPNTDNMKGLEAAAAAGIVAGKQEKKLEVIADVTPEQTKAIRAYLDQTDIKVRHVENGVTFDIILTVWKGEHSAQVRIAVFHTNIVHVEKDGEVLVDIPVHGDSEETLTDRTGDDIHEADTRQELMSLSARFGLTVTFQRPEKARFETILAELAKQHGIDMPMDQLLVKAEAFAIRAGGRSPRVAKQFIEQCEAGVQK